MAEAWAIFSRAFLGGFKNYGAFCKIWLPLAFLSLIIFFVIMQIIFLLNVLMMGIMTIFFPPFSTKSTSFRSSFEFSILDSMVGAPNQLDIIVIFFFFVALIILAAPAINTIRYSFGKYQTSISPPQIPWKTTLAFAGWLFIFLIIQMLLIYLFEYVLALVSIPTKDFQPITLGTFTFLIEILVYVLASWIIFRPSLWLVSCALQNKIGLGEIWQRTRGKGSLLFWLPFFITIFSWLLSYLIASMVGILGTFDPREASTFLATIALGLISVLGYIFDLVVIFTILSDVYEKYVAPNAQEQIEQ